MEILVIVSGNTLEAGNVLLMTRTWDVLQEIPLVQQDFGEGLNLIYFLLTKILIIVIFFTLILFSISQICFCWMGIQRNPISWLRGQGC